MRYFVELMHDPDRIATKIAMSVRRYDTLGEKRKRTCENNLTSSDKFYAKNAFIEVFRKDRGHGGRGY